MRKTYSTLSDYNSKAGKSFYRKGCFPVIREITGNASLHLQYPHTHNFLGDELIENTLSNCSIAPEKTVVSLEKRYDRMYELLAELF